MALADINLDAAKSAARAIGNNAIAMRCDVTKKADIAAAVAETLSAFGALDILVNNAGATHINKPMMEIGEAEFDRTLAVNVKGVFLVCQAVVPHFRKAGGGVIINIGSTAAVRPRPGLLGLQRHQGRGAHLDQALAVELAPDRIRVCAIAPVATDTPLLPCSSARPGQREKFVATRAARSPGAAAGHRQRGVVPGVNGCRIRHRQYRRSRRRPLRLSFCHAPALVAGIHVSCVARKRRGWPGQARP